MKVVWNTSQVWTNLFLGARLFGRAILLERTIGHAQKFGQNQSVNQSFFRRTISEKPWKT